VDRRALGSMIGRILQTVRLTCIATLATVPVMKRVSLNIDLGELPDEPDELYSIATIVNIACGGHAGDNASMRRAVGLALDAGAKVVAHPSYPDRENFGRKPMFMTFIRLAWTLRAQLLLLTTIAKYMRGSIFAIKPHGALYHNAAESPVTAEVLLTVAESLGEKTPAIIGPPTGLLKEKTIERGMTYFDEGFADRTYSSDGQLVPRSEPHALLTNPEDAAAQAVRLAQSGKFDTLCVHGDTPGSLEIARSVRRALLDGGLLLTNE